MVPDKFNMVDMGGIDLIMMQGEEVPGLYMRLVESIARCRYQCLYNWLFDGVVIPPTYVELRIGDEDEVVINEGITVTDDDIIHIYSIEPPPIEPVIISLTVEENGTYTAPTGVDGFNPVTVDVSATGDIPLFSDTEWGSLTSQQKRSYGLVAIQDAVTGYFRGDLVNGADFIGEMVQSGTGSASISGSITVSGSYVLAILALNSEASTHQLNIDAKINGASVIGETVSFNSYSDSGNNRRNYRLNQYPVTVVSGDTISIEVTDRTQFSSFVWALIDASALTLDKSISNADALATGTNVNSGFVLMGTFDSGSGGTIELEGYRANTIVSTQNPGTNYKSAYIFWFI